MPKGGRIGFGLRKRWRGQCMVLDYALLCKKDWRFGGRDLQLFEDVAFRLLLGCNCDW